MGFLLVFKKPVFSLYNYSVQFRMLMWSQLPGTQSLESSQEDDKETLLIYICIPHTLSRATKQPLTDSPFSEINVQVFKNIFLVFMRTKEAKKCNPLYKRTCNEFLR
jgi:hypothetical protein